MRFIYYRVVAGVLSIKKSVQILKTETVAVPSAEDVCMTDYFLDRLDNSSGSSYYYRLKDKQQDISWFIITYHIITLWFTKIRSAMKWLTTKISNGVPVIIKNETLNQLTAKNPPGQPKNENFFARTTGTNSFLSDLRSLMKTAFKQFCYWSF